jgi:hypothetical protein
MLPCLVVLYTQRPSGFKAIIKSIFKTNLPSLTSVPFFQPILSPFLSWNLQNSSKNEIYLQEIYQSSKQEMFAISLSSCSRYNANFNQCPLFMTVRHIFEISEDDHPSLVTHVRDNWRTLDFANALVSPGVNSRGELVPSHGASRRRLGDNNLTYKTNLWEKYEKFFAILFNSWMRRCSTRARRFLWRFKWRIPNLICCHFDGFKTSKKTANEIGNSSFETP